MKQRASPRRILPSDISDKEEEERSTYKSLQEIDRTSNKILSNEESHDQLSMTRPSQQLPCTQTQGMTDLEKNYWWTVKECFCLIDTDIREVLKDLQMLSSSLLEMETPQTTETVTDHMKESTT